MHISMYTHTHILYICWDSFPPENGIIPSGMFFSPLFSISPDIAWYDNMSGTIHWSCSLMAIYIIIYLASLTVLPQQELLSPTPCTAVWILLLPRSLEKDRTFQWKRPAQTQASEGSPINTGWWQCYVVILIRTGRDPLGQHMHIHRANWFYRRRI